MRNVLHWAGKWFAAAWPVMILVVALSLVAARVWSTRAKFATFIGCPDCFIWPVIGADAWLLAALCLLLLAAVNIRTAWISRPIGLLAALGILFYVTDLIVLQLFGTRLYLYQFAIYVRDITIVWDQYASFFAGPVQAAIAGIVIIGSSLLPALLPRRPHRAVNALLLLGGAAFVSTGIAVDPPQYVNNWIYRNVFAVNQAGTLTNRYSEAAAKDYLASYRSRFPDRCVEGEATHPNVVLLVIESWSAYQSEAFGGIYDWTPRLGAIARRHTRLMRFHANGATTNEGLANLLGGVRLFAPFSHFFATTPFQSAWGLEHTLPQSFNRAGYHTAFLTTGPLSFSRKGDWLRDIGFKHVEGGDHPFYRDWPKHSFGAAPDEALYRRALAWMRESRQPFMLTLETVSTHQPYIDPVTGERNMEAAFGYADRQAAWFYRQLAGRGYFDSGGILIITSDHRSMTPILPAERERAGLAAPSHIPLIWIEHDSGLPGTITQLYKLSDLLPSLTHRIHGRVCLDAFEASLFEQPPYPSNCIFHKRGDRHSLVNVLCAYGRGRVRLDGDHTRFIAHEGFSKTRRQQILTAIAHDRRRGSERER